MACFKNITWGKKKNSAVRNLSNVQIQKPLSVEILYESIM